MARACTKYLPAKLDKRVSIQSKTLATDDQGGGTETWATDATVWASIEPLTGRELMQAMQLETPITHKVRMRYRSGVTTVRRLLYGSRVFNIVQVINELEQNNWLDIRAVELTTS